MQLKYDEEKSGGQAELYSAPAPAYGAARAKGSRVVATPYSSGKGKDKGSGKGGGGGKSNARVFFSNVPWSTNEGYLRKQFEDVGTIVDFDFWRKPDGSSMGMGTCEYDHPGGAKRALDRLHDLIVDGRPLNIKMDDGGNKGGAR
jgi:RNA recognition motif-containing protein